jgi:hypothetical protein
MTAIPSLLSTTLMMSGVALVLFGFKTALGSTVSGVIASVAAIVGLLYAGAVWFGAGAPRPRPDLSASWSSPLIVFDRDGRIVSGAEKGRPVASLFPEVIRPEIEQRSTAALAGTSVRFACLYNGQAILLDALPVRSADGTIVYGILLSTQSEPATVGASA